MPKKPKTTKKPHRYAMGRPPKYRQEFVTKILEDPSCKGKDLTQIARALGVTTVTLYDWEKKYEDFSYSLQRAREAKQAALLDDYDNYKITSKGDRFADNAMVRLLSMSGYNRQLPELKGIDDELEGIQVVQDALADARISESFAASAVQLLKDKYMTRQFPGVTEEIQKLKDMISDDSNS